MWVIIALLSILLAISVAKLLKHRHEYYDMLECMRSMSINQPAQQNVAELTEEQRRSLAEYKNKQVKKKIEAQLKTMKFADYKRSVRRGRRKDGKDKVELDSTCCICVEELAPDTEIKITRCNHYFHYDCLFSWIDQKLPTPDCPFCRTKF